MESPGPAASTMRTLSSESRSCRFTTSTSHRISTFDLQKLEKAYPKQRCIMIQMPYMDYVHILHFSRHISNPTVSFLCPYMRLFNF
ncbi:hypothetical protein BOTBODRAFT_492977 [Botryobasidium botryosum FD-172 SS1]|uniref:Uncharacterized protein n=1 Tax=Botryobasidium botryosum (strain FD-172 SS1) TaxID=930990 RepID=A0A067MG02_BOTB1|nr:hypothetical protein BOTBODRAFT_492977 [Botryobasidium botryosum FD-172 SS1]